MSALGVDVFFVVINLRHQN